MPAALRNSQVSSNRRNSVSSLVVAASRRRLLPDREIISRAVGIADDDDDVSSQDGSLSNSASDSPRSRASRDRGHVQRDLESHGAISIASVPDLNRSLETSQEIHETTGITAGTYRSSSGVQRIQF